MKSLSICLFAILLLNTTTTIAQKKMRSQHSDTLLAREQLYFEKTIYNDLKYPASARDSNITGLVVVTFKVNNSKAYNINVLRSADTTLSKSVITLLQKTAVPAFKNPDVTYYVRVFFQVSGDDIEYQNSSHISKKALGDDGSPDKYFFNEVLILGYKKIIDTRVIKTPLN